MSMVNTNNGDVALRGLDRAVAFQVLTRADELMRSSWARAGKRDESTWFSGGVVLTRAEAVAQAREDLAHLVGGRTVSRSMLKRERVQRGHGL